MATEAAVRPAPWADKIPAPEPERAPISMKTVRAMEHDNHVAPTPTGFQKGEKDWPLNPAKEGVDSDDCPNPSCGNRDVAPMYRLGGTTIRSQEEYRFATTFQCGCCGAAWDRRTAQGAEKRAEKGIGTRRLDGSASRGRVYFLSPNTEQYRSNYARAFGHE